MVVRRNIHPQKRIVAPQFAIPEGLVDLEYDPNAPDDDLLFDVDEDDDDDPVKKKKKKKGQDDDDKGPRRGVEGLHVVKQILRTKPDGSQTVDVTVELDKVRGTDKYEFRITRKDTGKTTIA
jgi:hypothetical protein